MGTRKNGKSFFQKVAKRARKKVIEKASKKVVANVVGAALSKRQNRYAIGSRKVVGRSRVVVRRPSMRSFAAPAAKGTLWKGKRANPVRVQMPIALGKVQLPNPLPASGDAFAKNVGFDPGDNLNFPQLYHYAQMYDTYRINRCTLHYVNSVGSTEPGMLSMSFVFDTEEAKWASEVYIDKVEAGRSNACFVNVWSKASLSMVGSQCALPNYFTRISQIAADDARLEIPFQICIGVVGGTAGKTYGELFMDLDITFDHFNTNLAGASEVYYAYKTCGGTSSMFYGCTEVKWSGAPWVIHTNTSTNDLWEIQEPGVYRINVTLYTTITNPSVDDHWNIEMNNCSAFPYMNAVADGYVKMSANTYQHTGSAVGEHLQFSHQEIMVTPKTIDVSAKPRFFFNSLAGTGGQGFDGTILPYVCEIMISRFPNIDGYFTLMAPVPLHSPVSDSKDEFVDPGLRPCPPMSIFKKLSSDSCQFFSLLERIKKLELKDQVVSDDDPVETKSVSSTTSISKKKL